MPDKYVGQRLKDCRNICGFSRSELAERVGISEKFLYEIEVGRKNFSAEILYKLVSELSTTCEYIMSGKSEMDHIQKMKGEILSVTENMSPNELQAVTKVLDVILEISKYMQFG